LRRTPAGKAALAFAKSKRRSDEHVRKALKSYYPQYEGAVQDPRQALRDLLFDFRLGTGWPVTEIASQAEEHAERVLAQAPRSMSELIDERLNLPNE
jgi:hypothetical protein